MGPLDATWHVLNLFGPALGVGLLASAAAKLLWRRQLAATPYRHLAVWSCAVGCLVTLAMLILLGGDGRLLGYAALVAASACALWWAGFGPGRR